MTLNDFFQSLDQKSSYLFREFLWILKEKFELNEADLLSGFCVLEPQQITSLQDWVSKRREDYPLQYFIGSTDFMGKSFYVEPGVLIPRMETEEIVAWIIEQNKEKACAKILDVGAGSGCMGISLALNLKGVESLVLVEPYEDALKVLRKNVDKLCRGEFKTQVKPLFFEDYKFENKFNIIVSNPPYIRHQDPDVAKGVYEHEPHEALYGGELGWEKEVLWVQKSFDHLEEEGLMVFEFSHDQKEILAEKLKNFQPEFFKDSFGKDRFFAIRKPKGDGVG